MARIVSSSFEGASSMDVDPGQISFRRVVDNVIGDTNYVYDYVTGSNSPTYQHTHEGGQTGTPLGLPLASGQAHTYSTQGSTYRHEWISRDKSMASTLLVLDARLVRVPPGETSVRIAYSGRSMPVNEVDGTVKGLPVYAFCVAESNIASADISNLVEMADGDLGIQCDIDGLTSSTVYVAGICVVGNTGSSYFDNTVAVDTQMRPRCSVYFPRVASPTDPVLQYRLKTNASPPQISTIGVGTGGNVEAWYMPDDSATSDGDVISAMHIHQVSRCQNTLFEMLTGAPAGMDDGGLTLTDTTSGTDHRPFHDHSANTNHPSEDAAIMPLFADGCGTFGNAGEVLSTGVYGSCPSRSTAGGLKVYELVMVPDMPTTDVEFRALLFSETAIVMTAAVIVDNTTPGGESTTGMTVARIGSTNWYTATVTNPTGLTRGEVNLIQLQVVRGASGVVGIACFSAWVK